MQPEQRSAGFCCFRAQAVHSGRMHNAVKLQTIQRESYWAQAAGVGAGGVGRRGGANKGACEGQGDKHYAAE